MKVDQIVKFIFVGCFVCISLVSGCSSEAAKRTAYETLQNVSEQECLKNPSLDCERRQSYEEYARKRKDLDSSD